MADYATLHLPYACANEPEAPDAAKVDFAWRGNVI